MADNSDDERGGYGLAHLPFPPLVHFTGGIITEQVNVAIPQAWILKEEDGVVIVSKKKWQEMKDSLVSIPRYSSGFRWMKDARTGKKILWEASDTQEAS